MGLPGPRSIGASPISWYLGAARRPGAEPTLLLPLCCQAASDPRSQTHASSRQAQDGCPSVQLALRGQGCGCCDPWEQGACCPEQRGRVGGRECSPASYPVNNCLGPEGPQGRLLPCRKLPGCLGPAGCPLPSPVSSRASACPFLFQQGETLMGWDLGQASWAGGCSSPKGP